ncbi:hypothetical protein [Rhizobium leguminosarum]|uniref:TRAFAC clade GTPase domain-containing protein n=1 Tax=Rhizobium leguminosarum TaxID=384 RepID=UPI001F2ACE6C|nr:hypothetical protein [Rhizobium leguminosarum]UIK20658.1 hypothetical protein LZK79_29335 [Rhizobium leguminosarum]
MNNRSIVLVGGPDSGKTNYIGRLWLAFRARNGKLIADKLPTNIQYVDDAVAHLMTGRFAPRSERNMEDGRRDFTVQVTVAGTEGPLTNLTVPDITGELWNRAVETYQLPEEWIETLRGSSAAILFVRAHSKFNHQPMDWVTARDALKIEDLEGDDEDLDTVGDIDDDDDDDRVAIPEERPARQAQLSSLHEVAPTLPPDSDAPAAAAKTPKAKLPAQVALCELVRYLEHLLATRRDGGKPRVAVVVSAWDMLDAETRAAGPTAYLRSQFPLFAGRIEDFGQLEIKTFGLSIVGGDLKNNQAFKESVLGKDPSELGYCVTFKNGIVEQHADVTTPIAWALGY